MNHHENSIASSNTQNLFSKFTHIQTKKEYIDKRIKLEHSYVMFFAYSTNYSEENDYLSINQEWLDVFESIQENEKFSKYLEIVMFNQSADKKLLDLLFDENEQQENRSYESIQYPQIIIAHPHIMEPVFTRNPETFEIYQMVESNYNYYEHQFLNQKQKMFEKIQSLLSSYPVIIFIKGTPTDPFCKFSKSFMELIKKTEIKYKSFDIFKDEALRCWLRIYSGWKTYPQIYINGKIIGGVDKLNELIEKNKFLEMVPVECRKEGAVEKIQQLVLDNGVVVFGKGTLEKQQCKNSQEAYKILKGLNINFEIFDILTDDMMRAEVKKYFNYDYFPMVISEKFLGGIKFLKENNNFNMFKHIKLENNVFYTEYKDALNQYLKGDVENFVIVNLNKKDDALVNQEINSFIANNNLIPEKIKTISVNENEMLKRFFFQEINIPSESSFVLINDNKIVNIQ